jgi:hypothetical protein
MPCKDSEEAMNAADDEHPCTPPRPTGNDGAAHAESDAENASDSDEDLEPEKKRQRNWFGRTEFTLIKRWVTGEKAEMDSEDIERELFQLARDWMSESKLKKLPSHQSKPTDVSLWKQYRDYKVQKGSVNI